MLTDDVRESIAAAIYHGIQNTTPLPLLTKSYPEIELEDSYHIQSSVVTMFEKTGRHVRGYKIGLTSGAIQALVGSKSPNFGRLLDHMFAEENSELDRSTWLTPVAECELAFVLKDQLAGPDIRTEDVVNATDFIVPAIEIADFRVARTAGIDVRDITADIGAAGGVVIGQTPVLLRDIDICAVNTSLVINGEERAKGASDQVMGNPLSAVAWLANKLHELGRTLEPGDIILSGAMHAAQPIEAGDTVLARFDHGLGDIHVRFK